MRKTDEFGNIFWYKEGTNIFHRENGPAIIYSNGCRQYWINGKYLSHIKTDKELIIKLLLE